MSLSVLRKVRGGTGVAAGGQGEKKKFRWIELSVLESNE